MSNRLPQLGDRARDKVTGFTGILTTHASHLTGCDRMWVTPSVDDKGATREGMWVDIDMLEIVDPCVVEPIVYTRSAPGGVDLPTSK